MKNITFTLTGMRRFPLALGLALLLLFSSPVAFGQDAAKVRFAFLTDTHVAPGAASEKALNDVVAEINAAGFDFVLLTGDLTNNGTDKELIAVKEALDRLTIPVYVISGNHETNWSESACLTFTKLWGNDRFVFESGPYLFVGFPTGPYLKMGDGQVKTEDLYWLEDQLAHHDAKNKLLIVATHYPLGEGLANWFEVTDILNQYNARMTLCGHGHRLSIYNFDGIPGIMGRATAKKGSDTPGYNIVSLDGNTVRICEKEVGVSATEPFVAFSLTDRNAAQEIFAKANPNAAVRNSANGVISALRPDFSVNKQYKNAPVKTMVTYSASIFSGAVGSGNNLVYGTSTGNLINWDLKKSAISWRKQLGGSVYSTPSIYKNTVIQGTIEGWLYAFSLHNGEELWKLELGKPIIGDGIVEAGYLYIGDGNDIHKVDIAKGKIVWTSSHAAGQLQGRPTISGNSLVFGAWDRYLYCIDKMDGKEQWKWTNGHQGVLLSPANVVPVISKNIVFIVAPDRYMTAIDLKSGNTLWRTNEHQVRESMGASEDGKTIYAKLMNDSVAAIAVQGDRCNTLWVVDAGFGYEHNPCPIVEYKGVIYAGGKNGLLVAIDKLTHQVKWKHKCGNSAINKISIDHKNGLWVSTIEGKILNVQPS